jgi:hypothetical protein
VSVDGYNACHETAGLLLPQAAHARGKSAHVGAWFTHTGAVSECMMCALELERSTRKRQKQVWQNRKVGGSTHVHLGENAGSSGHDPSRPWPVAITKRSATPRVVIGMPAHPAAAIADDTPGMTCKRAHAPAHYARHANGVRRECTIQRTRVMTWLCDAHVARRNASRETRSKGERGKDSSCRAVCHSRGLRRWNASRQTCSKGKW